MCPFSLKSIYSMIISWYIQAAARITISSVLWLSSIPVYACAMESSISVSGHFGISCVLAIVIVLPWKSRSTCHFEWWFSLDISQGMGFAGSLDASVFSVSRNLHSVFHSGVTIYLPTKNCETILFSVHFLQELFFVDLFDDGHCDWCEVIPCSFVWHWLNNYWCGLSFCVLLLLFLHLVRTI